MRKILCSSFIMFLPLVWTKISTYAQDVGKNYTPPVVKKNPKSKDGADHLYNTPPTEGYREQPLGVVESRAQYDGNLHQFIAENFTYPQEALDNEVEGKVLVEFDIEADGSVSNVRSLSKIGYGLEEEAMRIIKKLKKFKPALKDNKPTKSKMRIPITINLQ